MADSYLSIAEIASDQWMTERMRAAATQQHYLGTVALDGGPLAWVEANRYVWASSPGWGAAWDSALAAHPPETEPDYQPGRDPGVITDGMILSTVQALGNQSASRQNQAANEPPEDERVENTADAVAAENG